MVTHSYSARRRAAAAIVLAVSAGAASSAFGQTAYFSFQGNLAANGDKEDFGFNLSRSVSNAETLRFQTFARTGGTNAAGDTIIGSAGGVDSVLQVFDSVNASRGLNDDQVTGSNLDSLVTWTQANGTALNPSPLPTGNYRLNQSGFNGNIGTYAVDLVGPANALSLTSRTPTGTSTVSSLKFGTIGAGASVATFNSGSNVNIAGTLGVGTTGNAALNVGGGTFTVGGVTTVNTNGRINLNGGSFTANNNVVLNAGKLFVNSATFNLGLNRTLNANTGAEFRIGNDYALGNGNAVTIQSGSTMSVGSFLDIGNGNGNGSVLVTGSGSSFSTNTLSSNASFWGRSGNTANVTISSQGTANISGAVDIGTSSTAGSSGTVGVNTGGSAIFRGLTVGGGTAGVGTITVDGTGSAVTQSGTSTLSVGAPSGTGSGTINLNNSGVFDTGTGAITINKTGTVNVAGGTFNANGDITLNGGKLLKTSGTFALGSGKDLTANNAAQVSFTGNYDIQNASTIRIQSGSSLTTTTDLSVGVTGSTGTLIVTGLGSSLVSNTTDTSIAPSFGLNGSTANVTITDQATATFNGFALNLGNSFNPASASNLTVSAGGKLTANTIRAGSSAGGKSTTTITGSNSSITQNGASEFILGDASPATGFGILNLESGGAFNSGTGAITIDKTGTVNLTGGTLNANGDVNLDGGKLLHTSGVFNLATAKNLTASNGAQVSFGGQQIINGGSTYTIQSGSSLSAPSTAAFAIGTVSGNGTLVVTGLNSSMTIGQPGTDVGPVWGGAGFTSNVTISNGATANINYDALFLANSTIATTSSTLNVTSGAQFNVKRLHVAANTAGTGVVNVTGTNSKLSATGYAGTSFQVGGTGTSSGTINVESGGTLLTGVGIMTITSKGTVNNPSGTITAAEVSNNGTLASAAATTTGAITGTGTTNVTGGTLTATGGIKQGALSITGTGKVTIPASASGSATSSAGTLAITGSKLDFTNNALVVKSSTLAAIDNLVTAGFNNGDWLGNGITSSTAANDPSGLTGIGYLTNAELGASSFEGITGLDGDDILVKYTYYGDADLNGVVDPDDFNSSSPDSKTRASRGPGCTEILTTTMRSTRMTSTSSSQRSRRTAHRCPNSCSRSRCRACRPTIGNCS